MAIIAYSIVFGLRYGVGADFFPYMDSYEYLRVTGYSNTLEQEKGFFFLTNLIASSNLPYSIYFGTIAFIQLFFIFYALKKESYVLSFLVITFMLGCTWLDFNNGLRQILALCYWALSVRYMTERKHIKALILVGLACLFHSSAFLLIIVYPFLVLKREWFVNVKYQLCLLFLSLVVMLTGFTQHLTSLMETVITLAGYEQYLKDDFSNQILKSASLGRMGPGFYLGLIINVIIVSQSTKLKKWTNSNYLISIYNLFFFGCLMKYTFLNSLLIMRLSYYFIGFNFIVAAYFLNYLYHKNKRNYIILLGLYLMTFMGFMYKMKDNTTLYIFSFQEEFYDYKIK